MLRLDCESGWLTFPGVVADVHYPRAKDYRFEFRYVNKRVWHLYCCTWLVMGNLNLSWKFWLLQLRQYHSLYDSGMWSCRASFVSQHAVLHLRLLYHNKFTCTVCIGYSVGLWFMQIYHYIRCITTSDRDRLHTCTWPSCTPKWSVRGGQSSDVHRTWHMKWVSSRARKCMLRCKLDFCCRPCRQVVSISLFSGWN